MTSTDSPRMSQSCFRERTQSLARGPSRVFLGPRARIHRLAYTPSSSVGLSFPDCTCW